MKYFNLFNFIKVLVLFSIGFISRVVINHSLGINVFLDYTNFISLLYYISLSFLSVYFDQLFSFNLISPVNVDSINIKIFNKDLKTNNLLFSNNSQPLYQRVRCKLSWYSLGKDRVTFGTYEEYKLNWEPDASVWKEVKNLFKWSFHWIDNKPSGIIDPKYIEERAERERR